MTIWLLAFGLLGGLVFVGQAQGVIRVGCSTLGIIAGWLLAVPLAPRVATLFNRLGLQDPVLPVLAGGALVFILVSAFFKTIGSYAHRATERRVKYHQSDTQFLLWERLSKRAGGCLAVVNATLYLIVISGVIYGFGYWTTQMSAGPTDPFALRMVNQGARGLQSSGFVKTAGASVPVGGAFYDAADLAGLLYNNSRAEARLARYPSFLGFAERPQFQAIAGDPEIVRMRRGSESLAKLIAAPPVQNVLTNRELMAELKTVISRDLKDLGNYLKSGKSATYDGEKILGHWKFSVNGTLAQVRNARPTISSSEMTRLRAYWMANFLNATLIATPDRGVFLKGLSNPNPSPGSPAAGEPARPTNTGEWNVAADGYKMTLQGRSGEMKVTIQGDLLVIAGFGMEIAFYREVWGG